MPRRVKAALVVAAAVLVLTAVVVAVRGGPSGQEEAAATSTTTASAAAVRRTTTTAQAAGRGGGLGELLRSLFAGLSAGGGLGGVDETLIEGCADALGTVAPAGSGGGGDPAAQVRSIATAVEEARDLRFRRVPAPVYVTPEEMARRVGEEVDHELAGPATAEQGRVLVALGALPAGSDLGALTRQALGQQVVGFYDPRSGELVVARAAGGQRLDGQSRIVLAHELDHALTDQAFGLPVEEGQPPAGAEDAALARLALVEGDATLVMQLYGLAHVPLLEQLLGLSGALASQEQLTRLPYHLQRSITFPYLAGLSFACSLYADGGWDAVDAAYKAPPSTSAQVLHPERYRSHEGAVDPRDPPPAGAGWAAGPVRALGAAELEWLLEAPGGDTARALDHPRERAAAWAGGEVRVSTAGDRTAVGVALVQRAGEQPLCATVTAWYRAAFPDARPAQRAAGEELAVDGPGQDAVVTCAGADVRLGVAPDLATARAVAR